MNHRVNPVLTIAMLGVLVAAEVVTLAADTAFVLRFEMQPGN